MRSTGKIYKLFIGVFIFLVVSSSCRKKEPAPVYLFRYRYQPGDILRYDISSRGEGQVKLTIEPSGKSPEEMSLPVQIKGKLVLEMEVKNVSETGEAELGMVFEDFNFTITNQVKDRELIIILNDQGMETREGEKVLKEVRRGEDNFPLNDILGRSFTIGVDPRGKITRIELPTGPDRSFPYLNFKDLLEQIQPEFPAEAVPVGESWTTEIEATIPGIGRPWDRGERWKAQLTSKFRGFEGEEKQVALLDLSGQVEQRDKEAAGKESSSTTKSYRQKLNGEIGFDLQNGKLLFSHTSLEQELDTRMGVERILKDGDIDIFITFRVDIDIKLQD